MCSSVVNSTKAYPLGRPCASSTPSTVSASAPKSLRGCRKSSSLCGSAAAVDRVTHQHSDSHWTHAPRHRGDLRSHLFALCEVGVPHQPVALLHRGVVYRVDAHVDHHRARLNPAALHHLCAAHCAHDDVCPAHHCLDVLRARVRDGDRGVSLHQQQGHGDAHDVGATQHHRVGALYCHTVPVQQLDAALGRAGDVEVYVVKRPRRAARSVGFGVCELSDVEGVEAIHIFVLLDGVEHGGLVDVGGDGQLHENAVHAGVRVQFEDLGHQLLLSNVCGVVDAEGLNSDLRAGPLLRAHIGGRVPALAHQDHRQTRRYPIFLLEFVDLHLELLPDDCRSGGSVDQSGHVFAGATSEQSGGHKSRPQSKAADEYVAERGKREQCKEDQLHAE
mmetsp:Transcript_9465/g.20743  ORF Transcript_9465/g.20743 Transcript_9465/m.20743 type:complete len:389 (-) Transcript_9465:6-1172(-)